MNLIIASKHLPSAKTRKRLLGLLLGGILVIVLSLLLGFNPLLFITEFRYMTNLLEDMFPPNTAVWTKGEVFGAIMETVAIALLGSALGLGLTFGLCYLGANNSTPSPVLNNLIKTIITLIRIVPTFIVTLILLITVGLGPITGILGITYRTIGLFGKLYITALEDVEVEPLHAIQAVGASRLQLMKYGLFPQALPGLVAALSYTVETNIKAAVVLGVLGAGGIGFDIHLALRMMRYPDATALIMITLGLILLVEKCSGYLRSRMLQQKV